MDIQDIAGLFLSETRERAQAGGVRPTRLPPGHPARVDVTLSLPGAQVHGGPKGHPRITPPAKPGQDPASFPEDQHSGVRSGAPSAPNELQPSRASLADADNAKHSAQSPAQSESADWSALTRYAKPPLAALVVAPHIADDDLPAVLGKIGREFAGSAGRAGVLVEGHGLWLVDSSLPPDGAGAADARDAKDVGEHVLELSVEVDAWILCVRNLDEAWEVLARTGRWIVPVLGGSEAGIAAYRSVKMLSAMGNARIVLAGEGPLGRLRDIVANFLPATRTDILPLDIVPAVNHELLRFGGDLRQVMTVVLADSLSAAEPWPIGEEEPDDVSAEAPAEHATASGGAKTEVAQDSRYKAASGPRDAGVSALYADEEARAARRSAIEQGIPVRTGEANAARAEAVVASAESTAVRADAGVTKPTKQAGYSAEVAGLNAAPASPETAALRMSDSAATTRAFAEAPTEELPTVLDLRGNSVLQTVLAEDASLTAVDLPLDDDTYLAVDQDGRAILLAEAGSMESLSIVATRLAWVRDNLALLARAARPLTLSATLAPAARVYVETRHASLTPLLNGDITVIPYRRLRWGNRIGLLLRAA